MIIYIIEKKAYNNLEINNLYITMHSKRRQVFLFKKLCNVFFRAPSEIAF